MLDFYAEETEEILCPSIVFKLQHGLYAINSKRVSSIMQLPKYESLPDTPPYITGVFSYAKQAVPLLDLRIVLSMPTLQEEYQEFVSMLEQRKRDHIHWVDELERSTLENREFTLATDPHKCAFGKWYDNYRSDNNTINFHLRKIDEPHKALHKAAFEVENCSGACNTCVRTECLKNVFERVKEVEMPAILDLLEEAKEVFRDAYREMVLVLQDEELGISAGIMVDEVLSVESLTEVSDKDPRLANGSCVKGVKKSQTLPGLILEISEEKILELARMGCGDGENLEKKIS